MCTGLELAFIGGGIASAAGNIAQGFQASRAYRSRASLLRTEAVRRRQIAEMDKKDYVRGASRLKARQRAAYAASGVDPFKGTPLGVQFDTAREAEYQAQKILVAGLTDASLMDYESELARNQARAALAGGFMSAGRTLLSGFGRAYAFGKSGKAKIPAAPTVAEYASLYGSGAADPGYGF
jgi:hypothetical protein